MLKVLLADDEEWCLEELSDILKATGKAEIIGAYSDAAAAVDAAIRDGPDMVFIDVQMPGIGGLELAKRLKRFSKEICIALVSEREDFARHGFDIGVDDYILKPVRIERVLKALEKGNVVFQRQSLALQGRNRQ